jgi:protein arginine N-methyltransferase 5
MKGVGLYSKKGRKEGIIRVPINKKGRKLEVEEKYVQPTKFSKKEVEVYCSSGSEDRDEDDSNSESNDNDNEFDSEDDSNDASEDNDMNGSVSSSQIGSDNGSQSGSSDDDDEEEDEVLALGIETNYVRDISETLYEASEIGQDFVCIPLVNSRYRRDANGISNNRNDSLTRSDTVIDCNDWQSNVIGRVSSWLEFDAFHGDDDMSTNKRQMQRAAVLTFEQEHSYALHLGLQSILLPTPSIKYPPINYARTILSLCHSSSSNGGVISPINMWVKIPLVMPNSIIKDTTTSMNNINSDGWLLWDKFRHLTEHNSQIHVALEIDHELPSVDSMNKWIAEPVKAIILPTRIFKPSKKNHLKKEKSFFLSRNHAIILKLLMSKFQLHIMVSGRPVGTNGDFGPYLSAVEKVWNEYKDNRKQFTLYDAFCMKYRDSLRSPLQPLKDNLQSETYKVMEEDPVKYERYEAAICEAMKDKSKIDNGIGKKKKPIVIIVIGPGRGPLIQASLNATKTTGLSTKIYAIEKNLNAIITLRNKGWKNVTIIHSDIRKWIPIELADIMVSELLGSWGDNELSPECLNEAQRVLKPTGISIPTEYTSYLAPMASSKLWMNARDMMTDKKGLETPFVVSFFNTHILTESKPLFKFTHPNKVQCEVIDNNRVISRYFTIKEDSIMHGIAGSFHCQLYKDIGFSTVPEDHSEGMFSWFPMFIPFTLPLKLKENDIVGLNVWRINDSNRVWYEYSVSINDISYPIQNVNGRSFWVGL